MIYFAYCTLLDFAEMRKYCPSAKPIKTGRLDGYSLTFATYAVGTTGGGCQLEPNAGGRIFGVLYELNVEDAANLDSVSGVDKGYYIHLPVNIVLMNEETVSAITYRIPNPGGPFQPSRVYVQPILAGARTAGFAAEYVEELERIVQSALGDV